MPSKSSRSLLEQVVHLDIETLDLRRGSGIHQMSLFAEAGRTGSVYYPDPNLIDIRSRIPGQQHILSSSPLDIHRKSSDLAIMKGRGARLSWQDAIVARLLMDKQARKRLEAQITLSSEKTLVEQVPWRLAEKELKQNWPWLYNTWKSGSFGIEGIHTKGPIASAAEMLERYNAKGANLANLTLHTGSIEGMLTPQSDFIQKMKNRVIMIANVDFESKQLGAQVAAREAGIRETALKERWGDAKLQKQLSEVNPFRQIIEHSSVSSPDVLYRTGAAYNEAVTRARVTGDWSGVFRPFVDTAQPGSVRDLLDIVRSKQSKLQNLGLMQGNRPFGVSVDTTYRLLQFAEAKTRPAMVKALIAGEYHEALLDTAKHQSYILNKELVLNEALETAARGGPEARELIKAAERGQGPLWEAIRYGQAADAFAENLSNAALKQRFARSFGTFATSFLETGQGYVTETSHTKPLWRSQVTSGGESLEVLTSFNQRKGFDSLSEAAKHILTRPEYASSKEASYIYDDFLRELERQQAITLTPEGPRVTSKEQAKRLETSAKLLYEDSRKSVDATFRSVAGKMPVTAGTPPPELTQKFKLAANNGMKKAQVKMFGLWAAGLSAAGALWALKGDVRRQRQGPESLRILNYEKWLDQQAYLYQMDDSHMKREPDKNVWQVTGLPKGGIGAAFRRQATDFGSPYQGMMYSSGVLGDLDLLQERELYTQEAFTRKLLGFETGFGRSSRSVAHNDPFAHPGPIASQMLQHSHARAMNHFFPGEDMFPNTVQGMRGQNLLQIDLSSNKWKVSVQDADTITVSRGGVAGAIQTFFGANKQYKFRLAGLDAPETQHGYNRAQPYAVAAKNAATQMVENARNLQLVVNPQNITYGRQVATIFGDGRNLNLEFIRRGMADHLPFYKKDIKAMYNESAYQAAANMAKKREVGMWSTPYFKAYRDMIASGAQAQTFNQLSNIATAARSSTLMSMRGQMWQAQQAGFYTNAMAIENADLGARIKKLSKKRNGKRANVTAADYISQEWRDIHTFATGAGPHKQYMPELFGETNKFIKTKGTNEVINKFRHKNIAHLDKRLAIDSITKQTIRGKRGYHSYNIYGNELEKAAQRKRTMEAMQQDINHRIFDSPINHHRM